MPNPLIASQVTLLEANRARFIRFVSSKVGDPQLAEDLLQTALLRAMQRRGATSRSAARELRVTGSSIRCRRSRRIEVGPTGRSQKWRQPVGQLLAEPLPPS